MQVIEAPRFAGLDVLEQAEDRVCTGAGAGGKSRIKLRLRASARCSIRCGSIC